MERFCICGKNGLLAALAVAAILRTPSVAAADVEPSLTLAAGATAVVQQGAETAHAKGLCYRCLGDGTIRLANAAGAKKGALWRFIEARHGTVTVDVSDCGFESFTFGGGAVGDQDGKIVLKASKTLKKVIFGSNYSNVPLAYSIANFEIQVDDKLVTDGVAVEFANTFALMAPPANYPNWTVATGSKISIGDANQSADAPPTGPGDLFAKFYDANGVLDVGPGGLDCDVTIMAPNALSAGKTLRTGGSRSVRFYFCCYHDWWSLWGIQGGDTANKRGSEAMKIRFNLDLASPDAKLLTGDANCLHFLGDLTGSGQLVFSNGAMNKQDRNNVYFDGRYALTGPVSCTSAGYGRLVFTNPLGYLGDATSAGASVSLVSEVGVEYRFADESRHEVRLGAVTVPAEFKSTPTSNAVLKVDGRTSLRLDALAGELRLECADGGRVTIADDDWKRTLDDDIVLWVDASAANTATNIYAQKAANGFKVGDPVTYVTPAPESLTVYAVDCWHDWRAGRTGEFYNRIWQNNGSSEAYQLPSYAALYPHLVPKGLNRRSYLSMNSSSLCRFHGAAGLGTAKYAVMVFGSQHGGGAAILGNAGKGAFGRDRSSFANPIVTNVAYRSEAFWVDGRPVDPTVTGLSGGWQTISVDLKDAKVTGIGFSQTGSGSSADARGQNYAEMLFFDRVLTAAERTKVERYLVAKWGLGETYRDEGPRAKVTLSGEGTVVLQTVVDVDRTGFAGEVRNAYRTMPRSREGLLFALCGEKPDPLAPKIDRSVAGNVFTGVRRIATDETSGYGLSLEGNRLHFGAGSTLYVYDVTSPASPRLLGTCPKIGVVRQLVSQRGMVYVSSRETGMWIVNATDPTAPFVESRYDAIELGTGIDVCGDVVMLGQRQNGVEFVDVSDPKHPAHIRAEKTSESQSTLYKDGICYSGDWGMGELTVIDAADMAGVAKRTVLKVHGYGDGLDAFGSRLYISTGHHYRHPNAQGTSWTSDASDETRPDYGLGHALEIVDISDPSDPVSLGRCAFDRFYRSGMDMWTPRVSGDGRHVFCADTYNGLYAVDAADAASPKIVGRITVPPADGSEAAPSRPVTSVAVGDGVVYLASSGGGLAVATCPVARQRAPKAETPPRNADWRYPYGQRTFEHLRIAWRPATGGQVRSVVAGDAGHLYVAAGSSGLYVLDDGFNELGHVDVPFCGDVKVRDGFLYSAESREGLAIYGLADPARPQLATRVTDFGSTLRAGGPIWVFAPKGTDRVVLSEHGLGGYGVYAPAAGWKKRLGNVTGAPGWDKYMADEMVGGVLGVNFRGAVSWLDFSGEKLVTTPVDGALSSGLNSGICSYGDSRYLLLAGGVVCYAVPGSTSSASWAQSVTKLKVGSSALNGQPVWDGGHQLGLTHRINRTVAKIDLADEMRPAVVWSETLDSCPDRAVFFNGKLVIPAGHQGVLVECENSDK